MTQRTLIAPVASQLAAVNHNMTRSVDSTRQLPKVRRHEKAGKPSLLSTTTLISAEWRPWPTALDLRQEDVTVHQGETPTHRHN